MAEASFRTVQEMLSSNHGRRGEGSIWNAGGYRYEEAASDASDHHLTTAGGVKLYVLPGANGRFPASAFGETQSALKLAWRAAGAHGVDLGGATYTIDAETEDSSDVHLYGPGTIKHAGSASDHALSVTGHTLRAVGVTFDGNRVNQSNRFEMIEVLGGSVDVVDCLFTGTVKSAIRCAGNLGVVRLHRSIWRDMAEHGGGLGQTSSAADIIATTADMISIAFNDVRHGMPQVAGRNPAGFFISMSGDECPVDCLFNYFENIGQRESSNFSGCIDLYTNSNKPNVSGNRAINSYWLPFKLQIANEVICRNNRVSGLADALSGGGIAVLQNVRDYASSLKNAIVAENIIDLGSGINLPAFIASGVDDHHSSGLLLHSNVVVRCGLLIQLDRVAYAALTDNAVEAALSTTGVVQIQNSDQGDGAPAMARIKINGGRLASSGSAPAIYARTNVTNLALDISGVVFVGNGSQSLVTVRNASELRFIGNDFETGSVTQLDVQNVSKAEVRGNRGPTGTLALSGVDDLEYGYNPGCWDFSGSATYDAPSVASGGVTTTTITVTGASFSLHDAVAKIATGVQGLIISAWVSGANTITVQFYNPTGSSIDLGSATLSARAIRRFPLAS